MTTTKKKKKCSSCSDFVAFLACHMSCVDYVFVGTYTTLTTLELKGSNGLGVYALQTNTELQVAAGPIDVGDNSFHPEFSVVYVTNEVSEGRISALRFEKQKFSTKGSGPISDGLQWNISIGLLFWKWWCRFI
mmetsp:Transcript_19052/g.23469  ORF Transcript_19052/g.23469 Transcript_19052/m.23469 type:complete len:133 (+) Transcript_19052:31-429(+)